MSLSKGWLYKVGLATVALVWVLGIGGCDSSPPQHFFASGQIKLSGAPAVQIKDAYVWHQPTGDTATVLLSDRTLPPLPADDAFAVVDLGLMHDWARASLGELALDAQGKLLGYAARSSAGGGQSAECEYNTGACYSATEYWNAHADWSDETMSASYEFGHELDITFAQPVHRQTRLQTPILSRYATKPQPRIDAQGNPTQHAAKDFEDMFARYQRVRKALDENSAAAFLDANGYAAALADAMLKFDGIAVGIARLAATCPPIDSYESFANDGTFGSLLIHHGNGETAVYFIRRGDDWILQQCGSG